MFPAKLPIIAQATSFNNSYSLYFDNIDDNISLGTIAAFGFGTNAFSISAWMKTTQTGYSWIFGMNTTNLAIGLNSGDLKARVFAGGGSAIIADAGTTLNDGEWHHYCVTRDGSSNLKIYIDNTVEKTATSSGSITAGTTTIGSWSNAADRWMGNIDEVSLWDVELDANAVSAIYGSGSPSFDLTKNNVNYDNSGDLIAYWRFEEGTGTSSTADSSDGGNDGTLNGAPTWSTDVPS